MQAFRTAAAVVDGLSDEQLDLKIRTNTLTDLRGIGPKTGAAIVQAHAGEVPEYLARLEETYGELVPLADDVAEFRALLRGDLHVHSDWSDGGSPIREMAEAAIGLGHEYMALTDHSPRLTVANGLSPERLERQLDAVAALNEELAPSGSSPASSATSTSTAASTRPTSCSAGSTSSSPACTPTCGPTRRP